MVPFWPLNSFTEINDDVNELVEIVSVITENVDNEFVNNNVVLMSPLTDKLFDKNVFEPTDNVVLIISFCV